MWSPAACLVLPIPGAAQQHAPTVHPQTADLHHCFGHAKASRVNGTSGKNLDLSRDKTSWKCKRCSLVHYRCLHSSWTLASPVLLQFWLSWKKFEFKSSWNLGKWSKNGCILWRFVISTPKHKVSSLPFWWGCRTALLWLIQCITTQVSTIVGFRNKNGNCLYHWKVKADASEPRAKCRNAVCNRKWRFHTHSAGGGIRPGTFWLQRVVAPYHKGSHRIWCTTKISRPEFHVSSATGNFSSQVWQGVLSQNGPQNCRCNAQVLTRSSQAEVHIQSNYHSF